MTVKHIVLSLICISCCSSATIGKDRIMIINMGCEMQKEPLAVATYNPLLNWQIVYNSGNGFIQSAYQIQVASSRKLLEKNCPDLWDSSKIPDGKSNNVSYNGPALALNKKYFWRVKVWDHYNQSSGWSEISWWQRGPDPDEWKALWIKSPREWQYTDSMMYSDIPAPIFRKEFNVSGNLKKAILYITGLGYYEAFMNGVKIGDQLLDPGWTDYSKRILYSTYDVTALLKKKNNCIGVILGNGWYNPLPLRLWGWLNLREYLHTGDPCFIAQLHLEYANGRQETIVSDLNWTVSDSEIRKNNIYLGETVDRRENPEKWNKPGFSDKAWDTPLLATPPTGILTPQVQPPVRITEKITPVKIIRQDNGSYLVDMGFNFSGNIRLTVHGDIGDTISVTYGELIDSNGKLNPMTSVAGQVKKRSVGGKGAPDVAIQQDIFILSEKGVEQTFQPRFTFRGFRYLEISGYKGELTAGKITGLRMQSDIQLNGRFSCSDELINQLQNITVNTFRNNIFSVQSDCPHRERFGYGGDILATCEAYLLNFNMSAFYEKTVHDFADAAREDGGLTETAPYVGISDAGLGGKSGPIGWGTAFPALLDKLYRYYGNKELIVRQYPVAKRWIEFLRSKAKDNLIDLGLSDHESIDRKPVALTGTAFYYYNVIIMARLAEITDNSNDVTEYRRLAESIKTAFIKKFLKKGSGEFDSHNQTAQSFALYFNLVPEEEVDAALKCLLNEIEVIHGGHLSTGIFGSIYMPLSLSYYGYGQKAFDIVTKKGFPGWSNMLENGATSLWEHWDWSDNTFSHNHPMFGSISEWFYKCIAGIEPADDAVGFDKILIRPGYFKNLEWAEANYQSINGSVVSKWKKEKGTFNLEVTIPSNSSATVFVPTTDPESVKGTGSPKAENILNTQEGSASYVLFQVGPGKYTFTSSLNL